MYNPSRKARQPENLETMGRASSITSSKYYVFEQLLNKYSYKYTYMGRRKSMYEIQAAVAMEQQKMRLDITTTAAAGPSI